MYSINVIVDDIKTLCQRNQHFSLRFHSFEALRSQFKEEVGTITECVIVDNKSKQKSSRTFLVEISHVKIVSQQKQDCITIICQRGSEDG